MKAIFLPLTAAILNWGARGNPLLGRASSAANFSGSATSRFLLGLMAPFGETRRGEYVLAVLEADSSWPAGRKYLELAFGRVLFGEDVLERVLEGDGWSRRTLFVVVLPREGEDDGVYVEDVRHQKCGSGSVLSGEDVLREFGGDVLPEGRRRSREGRLIKGTMRRFWKERILNVVVAAPKRSRVYTYTYFPYTEINCAEHLVPVLTNVWFEETSSFYREPKFFPEKTGNLFGCPLNVSLILTPPAVVLEDGRLGGIEGKMLSELFSFINASANVFFVNRSRSSGMSAVLRDVETGRSDLGAGFLVPTKNETCVADSIYVSVNLCLTWAVPNRAKIKNFIAYIFETFTVATWGAILVVVGVSGAFSWLLLSVAGATAPRRWFAPWVYVASAVLGEPGHPPDSLPFRVFLSFFVCFSILLAEVFQAGLGSNNIIVRPRSQIDTVEDVIDSGLQIKGSESAVPFFDRMQLPPGTRLDYGEIQDALLEVGLQRKTIYIGFKLPMKYYKNVANPELRRLIHIHPLCLVTYQPFLALRKNSPFSDRVSRFVTTMAENGYSDWLYNNFTRYEGHRSRRNKREEVDMVLFYGALQIWAYGMVVSFGAFLCELVFAKCRKVTAVGK